MRSQEYLKQLQEDFERSNFWRWFGIRVVHLEEGRAELVLPPSDHFLNVNQGVHGGVIVSLLDSVMGLTLRSTSPIPAVTQSLTTQFLRAPSPQATLRATATIIRQGRQVASIEGRVTEADGRLIAVGLATFIRLTEGQAKS